MNRLTLVLAMLFTASCMTTEGVPQELKRSPDLSTCSDDENCSIGELQANDMPYCGDGTCDPLEAPPVCHCPEDCGVPDHMIPVLCF